MFRSRIVKSESSAEVCGVIVITLVFMMSRTATHAAVQLSAHDQLEQIAVRYDTDQLALVVFHRNVAHMLPMHKAGRQIDHILGAHREKVCGHELLNG